MPFCLQQFAAGFDSAHFRRHIQAKLKRRNCLRQFAASHSQKTALNGIKFDPWNGRGVWNGLKFKAEVNLKDPYVVESLLDQTIAYFENNKQKYKFNILGLACVSINKKITRKNTFYCAEFVKHILKVSGITEVNELPQIIRPQNFKQLQGLRLEYEGLLKKYKKKKYLRLEEVHNLMQQIC